MQPFERWVLLRKFHHWHSISKTRGKAFRLLEKSTIEWKRLTWKRKLLREREKIARRACRACRINNALELSLTNVAKARIAAAAKIGRWLDRKQPPRVPISSRLDYLLSEVESKQQLGNDLAVEHDRGQLSHNIPPKQLHILGSVVTLSGDDLAGLMALKLFRYLLSQFGDEGRSHIRTAIANNSLHSAAASPIDRLKAVLKCPVDAEPALTLPGVQVLDLVSLAEDIQSELHEYKKANPELDKDLIQRRYVSTGSEEYGNFGTFPSISENNDAAVNIRDSVPKDADDVYADNIFDDEGQSFDQYLAEISMATTAGIGGGGASELNDEDHTSLVDTIAATANTELYAMKSDIDKTITRVQSSRKHLDNYKEFVAKKKKQRVQCIRDMQIHCCQCRGPHISKPPFSHGKDYRREPIHEQYQGKNCLFLKKKRAELKWLDSTIGDFCAKSKGFEREIRRRAVETQSRKENMKDALANSLRLLELASESYY